MNDLVEILRPEVVRRQIAGGLGEDQLGGAAIWKSGPGEVCVEFAYSVDDRTEVERWRERLAPDWRGWPHEFDAFQLLWIGRLVADPGPTDLWVLRLGPLGQRKQVLEVACCIAWRKGSPCWLEVKGHGPARIAILDPKRLTKERAALAEASRAIELIADFDSVQWRGGRPREETAWAEEFADKWRNFLRERHRRPRQREMADAMGHSTEYLKRRFREVIGARSGVIWDTYEP